MATKQINLYKKRIRQANNSRKRQALFIAEYVQTKYNEIYIEAAELYNHINVLYPKKPDLTRSDEFRNWKLVQKGTSKIKPHNSRTYSDLKWPYQGIVIEHKEIIEDTSVQDKETIEEIVARVPKRTLQLTIPLISAQHIHQLNHDQATNENGQDSDQATNENGQDSDQATNENGQDSDQATNENGQDSGQATNENGQDSDQATDKNGQDSDQATDKNGQDSDQATDKNGQDSDQATDKNGQDSDQAMDKNGQDSDQATNENRQDLGDWRQASDELDEIQPSIFDHASDKVITEIMEQLRGDPDISRLMDDIDMEYQFGDLDIGMEIELEDPLEEEMQSIM